MTHGSVFSGIEGFGLGAALAGIRTEWSCETSLYKRKLIAKNFGDEHEIHTDIRQLKFPRPVDILSGGFPCQDISIAGKGNGINGARSKLWFEMYRIIREIRPKYIIIENSPMLLVRGFEQILCNLSESGYHAEWQCLSGKDFGIQQNRERLYCIAYTDEVRQKNSSKESVFRQPYLQGEFVRIYPGWRGRCDLPEPRAIRSADDFPDLLDRIEGIGESVQPVIAFYLFRCIAMFNEQNS